jgi:hypothetical protein
MEGHIYFSVKGHNSHYGHFPILAITSRIEMAINMVFMRVYLKIYQRCRSIAKMQMVKSNGQNKFIAKIMAISLVFWFV